MCFISSSKTSGSVKMSRATRNTPFSALSSSAVSMVFWTVSSMLFLQLSFLIYSGGEALGRSVPDKSEHRLRAAAALRVAAASGIDLAWATGAVPDGVSNLRIAQSIAEADVHRTRLQAVPPRLKREPQEAPVPLARFAPLRRLWAFACPGLDGFLIIVFLRAGQEARLAVRNPRPNWLGAYLG